MMICGVGYRDQTDPELGTGLFYMNEGPPAG